ncbi:putative enzyme related to lactoylglutathione lyase [Saccharothrix tamanrassetensis]|uniref:Putative enzyme related to lactoylglutathione lyase n=1 Tax=Saccharothrix tamanrassetensis TaxID=1051531 RepID=A0A841CHB7_9PSEU|nr:VOC family protein [Saccharothrix tamanrassetensis]MBB5956781.1 putative enzyme related to lactoylglutathione lyase [Saccharothrix tamanrassetensis]
MTSRIIALALDAPPDPTDLCDSWCAALDYRVSRTWTDPKGVEYTELTGDGPLLLLQPVPEEKTVKNRLHLDLAADKDQDAEVARLVALGATVIENDPDFHWIVLTDPAGNEFCVLPPR